MSVTPYVGTTQPTLTSDTGLGIVTSLAITAAPRAAPYGSFLTLQDTFGTPIAQVQLNNDVAVGDTTVNIAPFDFTYDYTVANSTKVFGFVTPEIGVLGFSYRGLIFGSTLALGNLNLFPLTKIQGFDLPVIATKDAPRDLDTGEFIGVDLLGGRDIIVEITCAVPRVDPTTPLDDFRTLLSAMMTPDPAGTTEYPFFFSTESPGTVYGVNMRPRKMNFTIDSTSVQALGIAVSLQFHATDPRVYGLPTERLTLVSTGTSVAANITNAGSIEERPILTVTAGSGMPAPITIRNQTLPGAPALIFTTPMASGDVIIIDLDFHTAWYVPAAGSPFDCLSYLDDSSQWWNVPPGVNNIQFDSGTGDAQLDLDYGPAAYASV
jgi:Phage tail protein